MACLSILDEVGPGSDLTEFRKIGPNSGTGSALFHFGAVGDRCSSGGFFVMHRSASGQSAARRRGFGVVGCLILKADKPASVREVASMTQLRSSGIPTTAGPTRQPIDPVRFISNRSSRKNGLRDRRSRRAGWTARSIWSRVQWPFPLRRTPTSISSRWRRPGRWAPARPEESGQADVAIMAAVAGYRPGGSQRAEDREDPASRMDPASGEDRGHPGGAGLLSGFLGDCWSGLRRKRKSLRKQRPRQTRPQTMRPDRRQRREPGPTSALIPIRMRDLPLSL